MPEIGATLREARMRARIDVSEIEATTKIRAKYLRALENEEWGLLPGPTFVKSFLRTYAEALGPRRQGAGRGIPPLPGVARAKGPASRSSRAANGAAAAPPPAGPRAAICIAVGWILGVIVLLVVLLITNSGCGLEIATGELDEHARPPAHSRHPGLTGAASGSRPRDVSLSLHPTALVYVCLIGDNRRMVIPGLELQPGAAPPPTMQGALRSRSATATVTMVIDGAPADRAPLEPSDRLLDHEGPRAPGAAGRKQPTCQ